MLTLRGQTKIVIASRTNLRFGRIWPTIIIPGLALKRALSLLTAVVVPFSIDRQ